MFNIWFSKNLSVCHLDLLWIDRLITIERPETPYWSNHTYFTRRNKRKNNHIRITRIAFATTSSSHTSAQSRLSSVVQPYQTRHNNIRQKHAFNISVGGAHITENFVKHTWSSRQFRQTDQNLDISNMNSHNEQHFKI